MLYILYSLHAVHTVHTVHIVHAVQYTTGLCLTTCGEFLGTLGTPR